MTKAREALSKILKENKSLEGGLFVELTCRYISGGQFMVSRDLYTVRNDLVYHIFKGELHPTGDELGCIKMDCHRIGNYNPMKRYKHIESKTMSYSEVRKGLKI